MNAAAATYCKLPGRTVNFFGGRSRLWLADDHLLEVTGLLLAERYRRFPLADIRAFVIEKTRRHAIALWIYGSILALCLAVIAALYWSGTNIPSIQQAGAIAALWVFGSLAGIVGLIALIGLIITLVRGATCRCSIQTTAGLRELAAPANLRAAEKLVAILAPQITAAQTVATR